MKAKITKKGYTMFFAVVNLGIGSKVLREAREVGILGGSIFLGKGTAKNQILEFLGLDKIKKEIVLMAADSSVEDTMHQVLEERFQLHKPNHGIVFSLPSNKVISEKRYDCDEVPKEGGKEVMKDVMKYEVIFTIVDRGLAEAIVDATTSAGARGGTVIHGRESGSHASTKFLSMDIEPEKEIVMTLIEKAKTDAVIAAIEEVIEEDSTRDGVIFSMNVNRTSGLVNSD
ncbi:nitrogen regulatory protein PII [Clostridium punense]|uniref:Nitrogen regulatory protein PII n=2 Tax=Clostridium TaxID=1485 RepID=A0ABS4K0R8_9CLOT|nr:nitrogen regulatory protein PII [Clostridium punense]